MSDSSVQSQKLGILGGGQLGRMIIQSALDYNIDINILDPDENAPCRNIATEFHVGSLNDFESVYNFGKDCDIVTVEIENVNVEALKKLQKEGKNVYPQPEVIGLIQNKVKQKKFYYENFIPTSPFIETANREEVVKNKDFIPMVNKLATEGYDGRGVQMIRTEADLEKAFEKSGLVEKLVDFKKEISVIVARNNSGETSAFPAVELVYHPEANLVEYLFAPADISAEVIKEAERIAIEVIEKLDMIGLLAVEMFVTQEDKVLVNEVAPRPHNSGHQTIEANFTSQYEQHLRAIMNLPLGNTEAILPSAMVNLLGEDGYKGIARYEGLEEVMAEKGVHVHLYGKKLTKPFRKMGHVTLIGNDISALKDKVEFVKRTLKVIA